MDIRKLTTLALLVSLASVLHIVEGLIPVPIPVPGVKLGLANTVTLCTLVMFGLKDGLWVAFLRVVLGSLFGGFLLSATFAMSLAGSLVSGLVMYLIYRAGGHRFSLISVSICGAVAHNLAQLAMAAFVVQTSGVFAYLPFLLLFAVPTGFLTGVISTKLVRYFQKLPVFNQ